MRCDWRLPPWWPCAVALLTLVLAGCVTGPANDGAIGHGFAAPVRMSMTEDTARRINDYTLSLPIFDTVCPLARGASVTLHEILDACKLGDVLGWSAPSEVLECPIKLPSSEATLREVLLGVGRDRQVLFLLGIGGLLVRHVTYVPAPAQSTCRIGSPSNS